MWNVSVCKEDDDYDDDATTFDDDDDDDAINTSADEDNGDTDADTGVYNTCRHIAFTDTSSILVYATIW